MTLPPLQPPLQPTMTPKYRLFSPGGVTWATVFGTPLAGGFVLGLNYRRLGQKNRFWLCLIGGFLLLVALGALSLVLPDSIPQIAYTLPPLYLAFYLTKQYQGQQFRDHLNAGGKKASNWLGVGIGTLFLIPIATAIFFWIFSTGLTDLQHSVDMGNGEQVFYARGASRETAQRVADSLMAGGYFDGKDASTVIVAGTGPDKEIAFVVGDNAWNKPEITAAFEKLVEGLADPLGGKPITLRLMDDSLVEKKRLKIE